MAMLLLVAGGLFLWAYSFVDDNVHSQLAEQHISFPASGSPGLTGDPGIETYVTPYAGQQVTDGRQAKVFADHSIAVHLREIGGGQTYSEVGRRLPADEADRPVASAPAPARVQSASVPPAGRDPAGRAGLGTQIRTPHPCAGTLPGVTLTQRAAVGRAGAKGGTMNGTGARVAAATGAFYVVAIIVGEPLMASDTVGVARLGYGLAVLGFTAFVVFVAFVHPILRDAEGPGGWLATLALSAGLLHSAIRFGAQAPRMVGALRGDALSPELARTLEDLNGSAFVVTGLFLGLYCAAAGRVCAAHGVLPRWLGWSGAVTGVLAIAAAIVGMADPDRYVPVPFLVGLIWTLVVSVVLTVRPVRAVTARAMPATAVAPPADRSGTRSATLRAAGH